MKNIRRNARMEYLYGLGRSMKANAICGLSRQYIGYWTAMMCQDVPRLEV